MSNYWIKIDKITPNKIKIMRPTLHAWHNFGSLSFDVSLRVFSLRSLPNHSGSPVSKLLTTVRNFCVLPR